MANSEWEPKAFDLWIEIDENNNNKFTYYNNNMQSEFYGGVPQQQNLIDYIKLVKEYGNFNPLKRIIIEGADNSSYIKSLLKGAQAFGAENGVSILLKITNKEVIA